jgi:hypothetical protein
MGIFDWWFRIPSHFRYGVGIVLILVSTALYVFTDRLWPWGWVVGSVMLVFGFTGPEKRETPNDSGSTNQEA